MTTDFLIGAIRASDLHPLVKTELEERLYRGAGMSISEESAMDALRGAGWVECDYNCMPFAMVKAKLEGLERV